MATETKSPSVKLMKTPGKAASVAPAVTKESIIATTKTAAKTKAKAAEPVAAVETEAPAVDLILQTAHEIENMKSERAFKLVPQLLGNIDYDYFRLGGVLAVIQSQAWYQEHNHETFRSFVEAECGIAYRKAMYLIAIYNGLVASGVSWDQVKHLGWTKLKELASILSPENVADWVAVAESMTVLQLIEHIKASTKGGDSGNSPETDGVVSTTTTMTFKVHQDQKATIREGLDKAKHETGTEFDAVALEAMALDFLGGESKLKALPTLVEVMKGKSVEEVLQAFEEVFPDVGVEVTLPE